MESRDLRTYGTFQVNSVRRSLDSLTLPRDDIRGNLLKRRPGWGASFPLAATAGILAAAAHVTAIAEQQHQNDNPPPVVVQASAQAVIIVAHKSYLQDFSLSIAAHTPCYDRPHFLCFIRKFFSQLTAKKMYVKLVEDLNFP